MPMRAKVGSPDGVTRDALVSLVRAGRVATGMAILRFSFGTMGSGKSTMALQIQPPTTDLTLEQCGHAFLSGSMFTDEQMFHGVTAKLRREAPVHWVEHPDFNPFYVVTKHADVLDVELHPAEFLNAPRTVLLNKAGDQWQEMQGLIVKVL